jgi:regulator of sirC expression with transglutaminase-like and TPR domain
MPMHFVVKYPLGEAPEEGLFLDPFQGGAMVTPQQLRDRFVAQYRGRALFAEHYLGAVTKKQLLTRSLLNLKHLYLRRNEPRRVLKVLNYQLLIAPWDLETRRDRGLIALRLGDTALALDDLQTYERHATGDPNLPMIRSHIETLRRRAALGNEWAG